MSLPKHHSTISNAGSVERETRVKAQIRVSVAHFWQGFSFQRCFPYVCKKYDLVQSLTPEIVFYSVFCPGFRPSGDPRRDASIAQIPPGNYIRVFMTGENFEPDMNSCEFAITFSALTNHPNHLRLPLWIWEGRSWNYGPERLVKSSCSNWERIANRKTSFCNFVYKNSVPYRDALFRMLNDYKPIDAAARVLNNMDGWNVPQTPNRTAAKVSFFRPYKFTLAIENMIWPGYLTEKLVDPMFASSIPIYVGDPLAKLSFDPASYVDFTCFSTSKELLEFVQHVDNDKDLYVKMLAAPFYRNNKIPKYARDDTILAFFDRIMEAALARR
jgi:alpha(1,3/1,4) fucosyltransferase